MKHRQPETPDCCNSAGCPQFAGDGRGGCQAALFPVEGGEDFVFLHAVGVVSEGFAGLFAGVIDAQESVDEEVDVLGDDLAFGSPLDRVKNAGILPP